MSGQQGLSVYINTLNEEKNLPRCLDSLGDIPDEIIVVDSFSSDGTEEICKKRGVRFIQNSFAGHIEQHNFSMNQTRYDYVLSLDADEELSPELRDWLVKEKQDFKFDGYIFNRLSRIGDKWIRHSGFYPDKQFRLWNKQKGRPRGVNPHNEVVMEKGARVSRISKNIIHHAFEDIDSFVHQGVRYAKIAAVHRHKDGRKTSFLEVIIAPPVRFFVDYILKKGILDGKAGFIICGIRAYHKYLKCMYQYNLGKKVLSTKD